MAKRKSNAPQFLTETQVARLLKCADCARDKAAILMIYRLKADSTVASKLDLAA